MTDVTKKFLRNGFLCFSYLISVETLAHQFGFTSNIILEVHDLLVTFIAYPGITIFQCLAHRNRKEKNVTLLEDSIVLSNAYNFSYRAPSSNIDAQKEGIIEHIQPENLISEADPEFLLRRGWRETA